ncbi:MAG: transposase [Okeania sp. SIO2C2]|uniref:transposase n=1 Tax=Okeania sp. SIO2C2 TaxID=2607787 RepID=UPI0013BB3A52|nr:transposase [Okeania sp. SIO2C2]
MCNPKTRVHDVGKGRTWRKLHLDVNEATGKIVTAVVTTNDVSDDQVFSDLLEVLEGEIEQVSSDGAEAHDKYKCLETAHKREIKTTIPPRKNAVISCPLVSFV